MKAYIGTKIIQAEPQTRDGQPGYRVVYPDGYESWSPAVTFDEAYRPVSPGEARLVTFGSDEMVAAALEVTTPHYDINEAEAPADVSGNEDQNND